MTLVKSISIMLIIIMWLAGCQSQPSFVDQTEEQVQQSPDEINPFSPPPQLNHQRDWYAIFLPYIDSIVTSSNSFKSDAILLISDIQNRTSGYIAMSPVKTVLINLMNQQNRFQLADQNMVNDAKLKLGISYDDQLISRGKMVALAKSINADYLLFTTIFRTADENNDASLSMELLNTQTGEIIKRVTTQSLLEAKQAEENKRLFYLSPQQPNQAEPNQTPPVQTELIPGINGQFKVVSP